MSSSAPPPPDVPTRAKVLEAERELEQATSTRPQDPTRLTAALERAVDACRRWPQATAGVFYPAELLGELAEAYEGLGRTDDALATMQAAIDAGYTGAPDPRCRLAEILLRAGRAEEAHLIFTEVKAETPDDVWLYNNAGLEYGAARDHERAVAWLAEGLDLAIATGDRERLVAQMSDLRRASLAALGRELDELEARADEFLAQPPPPRPAWKPDELPGVLAALDAAAKGAVLAPTAAVPAINPSGGRVVLALSWFPREEFAAALEAWPQLADGWDTADHTEYNRRLQRHLAEIQRHLAEMPTAHGPAWIAPIQVDRLRSWCARTATIPPLGPPAPVTPPSSPAPPRPISSPGRRLATNRAGAAAGASTSSAADTRASQRHLWCSDGGHLLSIRVELVEGGHDSIWPRPGRIRRADSRERGAAAPQAEIRSLRLGSAKMRAG